MATRSRASMSWCVCGEPRPEPKPVANWYPGAPGVPSVDLLLRVHAPQPVLLDPAVEPDADDAAPAAGAPFYRSQHAGLQPCDHGSPRRGPAVQRHELVRRLGARLDESGATARQQRMVDPPFGSLPVTDAPPVLEFRRDLDRQRRPGKH